MSPILKIACIQGINKLVVDDSCYCNLKIALINVFLLFGDGMYGAQSPSRLMQDSRRLFLLRDAAMK